jgi:hypothetical protein
MRRRSRRPVPPDAPQVRRMFEAALERVEAAKGALVASVPTARVEGRPLAEAVLTFEAELRSAQGAMEEWRRSEHEDLWRACRDGIEEALRRAERARLEAPPLDFEALVDLIGEMMAPLDPFADAERRLGRPRR